MRVTARKIFFWTHLAAGIAAGALILVMAVTGCLMTWEPQITAWVDRWGISSHPPTPDSKPLSPETLIEQVKASRGVTPESITFYAGRTQPIEVYLKRNLGVYYADAYSGAVIGAPSEKTHTFFRTVRAWHRYLGASRQNRRPFRAAMDAANFVLLFLAIFGIYLWLPRRWTWKHLRAVLVLRLNLTGRARDFNWHNAIGIWSLVPLVVIVWTGMAMSYGWAKRMTYSAAGTPLAEKRGEERAEPQEAPTVETPATEQARFAGLSSLLARAERQSKGWKAITLEVPDDATDPVDFTLDMSGYRAVGQNAALELDRTGKVVEFTRAGSEGITARTFIRYGHTGEAWGVPGQAIAGTASLGCGVLVWTGIALSVRRFKSWRVRVAKRAAHGQAVSAPDKSLLAA